MSKQPKTHHGRRGRFGNARCGVCRRARRKACRHKARRPTARKRPARPARRAHQTQKLSAQKPRASQVYVPPEELMRLREEDARLRVQMQWLLDDDERMKPLCKEWNTSLKNARILVEGIRDGRIR